MLPITTPIEVLDIDVNLGPQGITFSGSGISGGEIKVHQAMALIRLRLILASGATGSFPTSPIQWARDGQPIDQPAFCTMRRVGAQHCLLEIVNSVEMEVETYFYLLVQNGDQFIVGDPTVLNLPPGGGHPQPSS